MIIVGTFAVIHRGYLEILDKYPEAIIGIISDDLAQELYRLEIDLRKMPVNKTAALLTSLGRDIILVNKENVENLNNFETIIIIEDDVTSQLKTRYLKGHSNLVYENGFFHHPQEQVYSQENNKIDLIKNYTSEDIQLMKQALVLAAQSGCFWRQVASIITLGGNIIYQAYNQMLPNNDECYKIGCIRDNFEPGTKTEVCSAVHSEASVIAQAAKEGRSLAGASIYVTVFPCPACAKLIALSGIKKCYYNTGWANFDGQRIMEANGVEIIKIDI